LHFCANIWRRFCSKPTAACSNKFHLLPGILIRQGEKEGDFEFIAKFWKSDDFQPNSGISRFRKEAKIQVGVAHLLSLAIQKQ
jgi:hypothetical protein